MLLGKRILYNLGGCSISIKIASRKSDVYRIGIFINILFYLLDSLIIAVDYYSVEVVQGCIAASTGMIFAWSLLPTLVS